MTDCQFNRFLWFAHLLVKSLIFHTFPPTFQPLLWLRQAQ